MQDISFDTQSSSDAPKPYHPPVRKVFGDSRELTLAGTGGGADGAAAYNANPDAVS